MISAAFSRNKYIKMISECCQCSELNGSELGWLERLSSALCEKGYLTRRQTEVLERITKKAWAIRNSRENSLKGASQVSAGLKQRILLSKSPMQRIVFKYNRSEV